MARLLPALGIGLLAGILAFKFSSSLAEAGRTSTIGPLEGTYAFSSAEDGPAEIRFDVSADLQYPARWVQYAEEVRGRVRILEPDALPATTDLAALNTVIAGFVQEQAATHPGLAKLAVPVLESGEREAESLRTRTVWGGILQNGIYLIGIFAGVSFVAFWIIAAGSAFRRRRIAARTA